MSNEAVFRPHEPEGTWDLLFEKLRKSPFATIGMIGFFGVGGYGIYNFKNRGNVSASVYLMQLRVTAQGAAVGILCLGLIHSMLDRYYFKKRLSSGSDPENKQ